MSWLTPLQNVPSRARTVKLLTNMTIKPRAVIVDGVLYESLGDASRAVGISVAAIYYRVQHHVRGARYADDEE